MMKCGMVKNVVIIFLLVSALAIPPQHLQLMEIHTRIKTFLNPFLVSLMELAKSTLGVMIKMIGMMSGKARIRISIIGVIGMAIKKGKTTVV